jgi:sec-independent protein translocase protein TatC
MTFLEHLDELRKRITHAVGGLLVGFIIAFAFINRLRFVYSACRRHPGGKLIYTEAAEMFMLWIKIAALTGVLIASPYIMLQVWLFIAPGLYAKEKSSRFPSCCPRRAVHRRRRVFALLRVPARVEFLRELLERLRGVPAARRSDLRDVREADARHRPHLPVAGADVRAGRLGIVTAGFLLRNFKYAVLLIFIFAAVITPDGNP